MYMKVEIYLLVIVACYTSLNGKDELNNYATIKAVKGEIFCSVM